MGGGERTLEELLEDSNAIRGGHKHLAGGLDEKKKDAEDAEKRALPQRLGY